MSARRCKWRDFPGRSVVRWCSCRRQCGMGPSRQCSIRQYRTEWRTSSFLCLPLSYPSVVCGLQKPQFGCWSYRLLWLWRSCWHRWRSPVDWQVGSCVWRSVPHAAASSFRGRRWSSRQRWGCTACGDRGSPAQSQTQDSRLERTCRQRPSSEERGPRWWDTRRFRQR